MTLSTKQRTIYLFLAAAILLVAAILRLIAIAQYPPGPHYDEAVNLLAARSIAFGGARFFPMLEAYQGREVLWFYLNAPLLTLIHDSMFPFHISAAFLNLLTVAASIRLGRLLFRGWRGVVIGVAMGVMMCLSFPQIWLGRQAFRAVTLPFCQAMALVFLWRGLRLDWRKGWRWLVIGGFFAGAALYTYNSSRLFPLWLAIGGLALLIADRANWRVRIKQGGLFFGVLTVVALPMAIYAVQRPDIFFNRLAEVTNTGTDVSLWESVIIHARMFFIEGDPLLRYNIPLRPYLTLPEGILMLAGICVCIIRLFRQGIAPIERTAYLMALLSPLMTIPSVISVGGLPPNHMRSLGMIPLLFVLVAVGFEWGWSKFKRIPPRVGLSAVTFIALLIGGVSVGNEYFRWASRTDLFFETDGDLAAAVNWLRDHANTDDIVYISDEYPHNPAVLIANLPNNVRWLSHESFSPPHGRNGWVILSSTSGVYPESPTCYSPYRFEFDPVQRFDLPTIPNCTCGGNGEMNACPAFLLLEAESSVSDVDRYYTREARNRYLTLLDSRMAVNPPPVPADLPFQRFTTWLVVAPPLVSDFALIFQVEDEQGFVLDRAELPLTDTDKWIPGEVMTLSYLGMLPAGTPPGEYRMMATWVERSTETYTPYLNTDGTQAGIWTQAATVEIIDAENPVDPADLRVNVRRDLDITPALRLIGWDTLPTQVRPGESIPVFTTWYASADAAQDDTPLNGSLLLGDGTFCGVSTFRLETLPAQRAYTLRDQCEIPRELTAGTYPITLQMGDVRVDMGAIEIGSVPRVFDPPPVERESGAVFLESGSDSISLYGYTVDVSEAGVSLELVWQSIREVQTDYTVFVHLLDADGQIIAQSDAMPRAAEGEPYPTSLWLAGEYVRETFTFAGVQPQTIRVGLYQQSSGERLDVRPLNNRDVNDFVNIDWDS